MIYIFAGNGQQATRYMQDHKLGKEDAKYIAKESEYDTYQHDVPEWFKNVGRWWGCYNRPALNIIKRRLKITPYTKELLTENIRKY